ncbi:hypothetical protein P4V98_31260, partial [Bacillus thuringiensis]|nr:hypothetical protein [Bacillus thuringiensis]
MEKKYIEFILENQEHMKKIEELEKISREYMDYLLDKLEITSNGVSISDSKVHNWGYIESEFEKLIVDNYFVDNECDYFGMIDDGCKCQDKHVHFRLFKHVQNQSFS